MATVIFNLQDAAGTALNRNVTISPASGTIGVSGNNIVFGEITYATVNGTFTCTLLAGEYYVRIGQAGQPFAITVPSDSGTYYASGLVSSTLTDVATAEARINAGKLQILFPDGEWRDVVGITVGDQNTLDVTQN